MPECLSFTLDADGIALVTIDVQGRPMNVLTAAFGRELEACIGRLESEPGIRGAVITSAKADFMAGADLKWILATALAIRTAEDALAFAAPLNALLRRLETCGKPVVAAINGTALGGGLELALACHHRVAAANPSARIGLPEVLVGLLPGGGGTQRLPRLIGIREALTLMVEGTHLGVHDALARGILHRAVPPEALLEEARRYILDGGKASNPWDEKGFRIPGGAGSLHPAAAQTFMQGAALVSGRTSHNYPAPIAILSAVYEGTQLPIDLGLAVETRYFCTLLLDPVARSMIRTLFVNKGAAERGARRPVACEPRPVRTLGLLGAGMMGAGIAYVSARAGIDVKLLDTSLERASKGKSYGAALVARDVERGRLTEAAGATMLARITPTTHYAELADCDLVIEAVFEDRATKAGVTQRAEAVLPAAATVASNTSTLPITGLAEASARPAQFIGIHFFSPVEKMALVEIIRGAETSDAALAQALDYVRQLRKTPIVVNDGRGFYTSRVCATYTNEGMTLLGEGVKPALVENVAQQAGFPVGPLAVLDEMTLEFAHHLASQAARDLGAAHRPASGWPVLRRMVEELGRLGKRHGQGFYEYPADGRKRLWPGLDRYFPATASQPLPAEVRTRLLYVQALEAARCLEEAVLGHPVDGDLGAVLGWGFPAWTGGPFSLIDTVGIRGFVGEAERLAAAHGPRFAPSPWLRARAERGEAFY